MYNSKGKNVIIDISNKRGKIMDVERESCSTMDDIKKKEIQDAIAEGDYQQAESLLQEYKKMFTNYDDIIAILDAGIGEYYGDRQRVWDAIRKGLTSNGKNYELYVMLGNYYLTENMYQSYLCYENALFYCDVVEDKNEIRQLLYQLHDQYNIMVNQTTIVVLLKNSIEFTKLCIKSIRLTISDSIRKIIVVDSGSADGSVEWLKNQKDILLVENIEKINFSTGCNQGIEKSLGNSDIFILDSDTVLPPNALFWLRMGLYSKKENGVARSISNLEIDPQKFDLINNISDLFLVGEQINIPMRYSQENKISLNPFAFLVKAPVLERIGMFDEKFSLDEYGARDFGLRILASGYKNVLCKNSFIIHFGTEFRMEKTAEYTNILVDNQNRLNEKWGFNVGYYLYPRQELAKLVDEPTEKPLKILDIGCGCGALIGYLKGIYPNAEMFGIELNSEVAKIASSMGKVVCGDVEKKEFAWEKDYFDYIIMGDVLEHLMTPEYVLKRFYKCLKTGGHIIVSMPNVKHYSVLLPLLRHDIFPYSDAGILDRTHVKMYTGVEIHNLLTRSGYKIEIINCTKFGQPNREDDEIIDVLTSLMKQPSKESFLAYQYIFKAVKR